MQPIHYNLSISWCKTYINKWLFSSVMYEYFLHVGSSRHISLKFTAVPANPIPSHTEMTPSDIRKIVQIMRQKKRYPFVSRCDLNGTSQYPTSGLENCFVRKQVTGISPLTLKIDRATRPFFKFDMRHEGLSDRATLVFFLIRHSTGAWKS